MSRRQSQEPSVPGFPGANLSGIKMLLALFFDREIPILLKLLPLFGGLWIVLPDIIPGPLDDLGVAFFAPQLFIDLCRDKHPKTYERHYQRIYGED